MENVIEQLKEIVGDSRIFLDEGLNKYTTFRIGGKCKALVMPATKDEVVAVIKLLRQKNVNYFVMGNGSNLLVSDEGFDGVIVSLKFYKGIEVLEDTDTKLVVKVASGEMMISVGNYVANLGAKGFEFATGIPGTIGGGIRMNAGAYGGELKDFATEVIALSDKNEIVSLSNEEMQFGYRKSLLALKDYICLEVKFEFAKGNVDEIKAVIKDLSERRKEKQPLNYPSAGSTFKRPEGHFAAKLIDDAGLRGLQVGGARVSDKHCGFVVNMGGATAKDVIDLTDKIKKTIKDKDGVDLELEVIKLGF